MKVNITYPPRRKNRPSRSDVISAARWPFLLGAYLCPILNICVGGRAWSLVVLWGLWMAWSNVFATDMVDYNRISQFSKLVSQSCVMLIIIDAFLSPGWAVEVVPIVCFSGLIVAGALFFTDIDRQRHNLMPLLLLAVVSLVCSIAGLIIWRGSKVWPLVVMGALALALLIVSLNTLGAGFLSMLKKYFHIR